MNLDNETYLKKNNNETAEQQQQQQQIMKSWRNKPNNELKKDSFKESR